MVAFCFCKEKGRSEASGALFVRSEHKANAAEGKENDLQSSQVLGCII